MSGDSQNHNSSATHHRTQRSTTLNRKYVHRPEGRLRHLDIQEEPQITSFAKCQAENQRRREELAEKINRERLAAMKKRSAKRISIQDPTERTIVHKPIIIEQQEQFTPQEAPAQQVQQPQQFHQADQWSAMPAAQSARQLKDEAIRQAMRSVATMESQDNRSKKQSARSNKAAKSKRIALAIACSLAAVAGIGYFVSVNMPDIATRVTAMQSGIADPYPSYIPRGFSLVTSSSNDTSIQMVFGDSEGHKFTLAEEKSSWDSKALVSGYVDKNWTTYDTVKEQGLSIYIFGSSAAWVNGGIKYTISADPGTLTQKQIKNIATSL